MVAVVEMQIAELHSVRVVVQVLVFAVVFAFVLAVVAAGARYSSPSPKAERSKCKEMIRNRGTVPWRLYSSVPQKLET